MSGDGKRVGESLSLSSLENTSSVDAGLGANVLASCLLTLRPSPKAGPGETA